jgi:uncharacterized protein
MYTVTFFASGIAACILSGTLNAIGVASGPQPYIPLEGTDLNNAVVLLASAVATTGLAVWQARGKAKAFVANAYAGVTGLLFAVALAFSGMTRPSVVASCLALVNFTLMFVMAGALAVALPVFQLFILKREEACDGSKMTLPSSSLLDWKLLLGGVLFGVGWGVSGFCPGPAIASLARPQLQNLAFVVSMALSMIVVDTSIKRCNIPSSKAA